MKRLQGYQAVYRCNSQTLAKVAQAKSKLVERFRLLGDGGVGRSGRTGTKRLGWRTKGKFPTMCRIMPCLLLTSDKPTENTIYDSIPLSWADPRDRRADFGYVDADDCAGDNRISHTLYFTSNPRQYVYFVSRASSWRNNERQDLWSSAAGTSHISLDPFLNPT